MLHRNRVLARFVDAWIERVEDGLVRGGGGRGVGEDFGENHAMGGELVEVGTGVALRIVATQEIGPQGVDGYENDPFDRRDGHRRLLGGASGEAKNGENRKAGGVPTRSAEQGGR